ncbi:MAG: nicotinate phosphoribosyltransferase [Planctomycetaceae bacterium]|nr:nicotinate phosphoribosyltransferase [Planctomycetaceae bacterium]
MHPTENLILRTDSYKFTHWKQYPPGTERVYSYFESRGGQWSDVVFFGLQYYLKRFFEGQVITAKKIDEAERLLALHFDNPRLFNRAGWEHIVRAHDGRLPVVIKAVPEGCVVPGHNVLMTIENTDPDCYWLTNYLETLLVQVWYGSTVATQSREMKKRILGYLNRTGDPGLIDFKLHDFGFRGVSSVESAGVGGAAHLVNFLGSDTFEGIMIARAFYGESMAGFSIPAAEHSTICSWGEKHEADAMQNMLSQYPTGLVAVVSDSFDIFAACREVWGERLRDQVLGRDGCVIIRADSGDPPTVLASGRPSVLGILADKFGYRANAKGYKVLTPRIRVIQSDWVDFEMLDRVLSAMERAGFSADNISFGSGGGLLQKLNRDTLKFAFKCAAVVVNGRERDVYKNPVTDPAKQSKGGRLKLICDGEQEGRRYRTVRADQPGRDELVEVFRNGRITREWTFAEIRHRARIA